MDENFIVDFGEVTRVETGDFNKLNNRPSYAGELMTGDTDIPKVPTKTSELTNDQNYQTGAEVQSAVSSATSGKQDKLTAGANISISNNVISAIVGLDSVGNGNIKDKAISFTKIDDLLAANLDLEYEPVEVSYTNGFYYPTGYSVGGNLNYANTDASTECAEVELVKGKTYRFTGTSYSSTFGILIGTAIGSPTLAGCSKDGKLNKSVYSEPANDQQGSDYIFTVYADNLKAFITRNKWASGAGIKMNILEDVYGLYEVTKITTRNQNEVLNTYETVSPGVTHTSKFLDATSTTGNPYRLKDVSDARYVVKTYKLRRGHTYKVSGHQIYGNPGFELFDGSNILQYISLVAYAATRESYEYEFTVSSDCFCAISDTPSNNTGTLYEKVHTDEEPSRIAGKTIAYNGDSITESRTNSASVSYNAGAYPKLIADTTNSSYANFAVGGGTLAYKSGGGHRICRDIVNMNGNYDAIIFSGGINDYWQNIPLGTYSESDYTSDVDDTTVCGALESIFRQAINKWCGKPIMFVITHKIYNTVYNDNSAGYSFKDLHDAIVGICDKYSIPYYDCYKDGGLNSYMSIMNTTYMTAGASGQPDYTHPNEEAYKRYYVPQVISMIEENLKYSGASS